MMYQGNPGMMAPPGGYGNAYGSSYGNMMAKPGDYGGMPPGYGATMEPMMQGYGDAWGKSQRPRINIPLIMLGVLVPWALFVLLMWTISFQLHYKTEGLCNLLTICAFCIAAYFGVSAASLAYKRSKGDYSASDPSWWFFLFITSLAACVVAFFIGNMNFLSNMRPYYDVMTLNTYSSVDPAQYTGQQMMDAGRVIFSSEAHLDTSKSIGFRNYDTYCVAPITSGSTGLDNYDFWAVGTNCCSGSNEREYHCGEFNNPSAHSGLRLMNDEQRSYFRLAVQQAEAAYNIQASHPILMYWMQDPDNEIQAYYDAGEKMFAYSIFLYFAVQLFLTIIAVLVIK